MGQIEERAEKNEELVECELDFFNISVFLVANCSDILKI